ncbi:hypothetical protein BDV95DRAFT_115641 [Massariosphaeria phaeospora]|uniref:Uncharacterized protein n=1 Tax=Massariosphaeria phaeospora TaxID=100035 RepID=A0A7C8I2N2_9PLEO|nr:hypothetical protein BDV95DRAFT_115641 [Massariosphaeria phaeospora]
MHLPITYPGLRQGTHPLYGTRSQRRLTKGQGRTGCIDRCHRSTCLGFCNAVCSPARSSDLSPSRPLIRVSILMECPLNSSKMRVLSVLRLAEQQFKLGKKYFTTHDSRVKNIKDSGAHVVLQLAGLDTMTDVVFNTFSDAEQAALYTLLTPLRDANADWKSNNKLEREKVLLVKKVTRTALQQIIPKCSHNATTSSNALDQLIVGNYHATAVLQDEEGMLSGPEGIHKYTHQATEPRFAFDGISRQVLEGLAKHTAPYRTDEFSRILPSACAHSESSSPGVENFPRTLLSSFRPQPFPSHCSGA